MNENDPNIDIVEVVVSALGDLREELVLVGGCAAGLMITEDDRPPVRATVDVDPVAEVVTHTEYHALAKKLRKIGFHEDQGNVICRWRYRDVIIDVMPTAADILGFSNRWYEQAVKEAQDFILPSGTTIKLISPPLLFATKLEAFYGRGNGDYGASHDIEDIMNLVDGRPELLIEIEHADHILRDYLKDEVEDLLAEPLFIDTIPWHFGANKENQERVPIVISRLRKIAGI